MKRYKKSFRTRKRVSIWSTLKRTIKSKFFWLAFLFLFVGSGLTYLLFFSSVFQIKNVEVLGCKKTSPEEIQEIVSGKINKNIFLADLNSLTTNLIQQYPQIAKINIERKLPNEILVQIEERKPVAGLKRDKFNFSNILKDISLFGDNNNEPEQDYYLIDKEGIIFEKASEIPSGIVTIKSWETEIVLGKTSLGKERIESILKIVNDLRLPLAEIELVSEKRINIKTSEGWEAFFNPQNNLDWQIEQLNIILKEKIPSEFRKNLQYIDLRFEKIYIFPENYQK